MYVNHIVSCCLHHEVRQPDIFPRRIRTCLVRGLVIDERCDKVVHGPLTEVDEQRDDLAGCAVGHGAEQGGARCGAGL